MDDPTNTRNKNRKQIKLLSNTSLHSNATSGLGLTLLMMSNESTDVKCLNAMTLDIWRQSTLVNSNPVPFHVAFDRRLDRCIDLMILLQGKNIDYGINGYTRVEK